MLTIGMRRTAMVERIALAATLLENRRAIELGRSGRTTAENCRVLWGLKPHDLGFQRRKRLGVRFCNNGHGIWIKHLGKKPVIRLSVSFEIRWEIKPGRCLRIEKLLAFERGIAGSAGAKY